jgi:hypothetical protein
MAKTWGLTSSSGTSASSLIDHIVGQTLRSGGYWLARRKICCSLLAMALDIYAVLAMADEPERLFSQAGEVISTQRRRLSDDSVPSLMCLRSWRSSGIIKIDKSLFERAIEAAVVAEDWTPAPGLVVAQ